MKLRILIIVFLCAAAGVSVWYYINSSAAAPAAKPPAVASAPAAKPAPAVKPGAIEPPKPVVAAPVAPKMAPSAAPVAKNAEPPALEPKADLHECIAQTLKLLEAKDIPGLIRTLMPPSAMQQMIDAGRATSVDDVVAIYSQRPDLNEKIAELQQVLESIKDATPEMSADGQRATYKLDGSTVDPKGRPDISFVQEGGNWYLR